MTTGSSGGDRRRPPKQAGLSFSGSGSSSEGSGEEKKQDRPKLGAGGTSFRGEEADRQAQDQAKGDGDQQGKGGKGLKGALAAASLPAAIMGLQLLMLMMFAKLLKGLIMAIAAAAVNLWNMVMGFMIGVAQQIGSALLAAGSAVSTVVGGAVSAATGTLAMIGGGILAVATVVSGAVTNNAEEQAQRTEGAIECLPVAERTLDSVQTEPGALNAAANAELIYSVVAAWGMPDENIAGMLGNWDAESEIDPTGVETIMDESHRIGPKKQEAWDLGWDIASFDPEYSAEFPAIDKMGIGLGQWTNGRNTLLTDYADSVGRDWHEIETQLGFMVSEDDPARVAYIEESIANSRGSVEEATLSFMADWEGLSDSSTSARVDSAENWMAMFSAWDVDESLADSILSQSGATVDSANQQRAAQVRAECQDAATAVAAGDAHYAGDISDEGWAEPTETMHVTSLWGPRNNPNGSGCRAHDGLDLDGTYGDPYFAAHDGTIADLEWLDTGGWTLTLELSDGSGFLKYLHTNSTPESAAGDPEFFVEVGDVVTAGDHIGNIGNTGLSGGAHLHFEIHESDSTWVGWPDGYSGTINPKTFLEDQGFNFTGVQGIANSC